jgi:hypothetical protein
MKTSAAIPASILFLVGRMETSSECATVADTADIGLSRSFLKPGWETAPRGAVSAAAPAGPTATRTADLTDGHYPGDSTPATAPTLVPKPAVAEHIMSAPKALTGLEPA